MKLCNKYDTKIAGIKPNICKILHFKLLQFTEVNIRINFTPYHQQKDNSAYHFPIMNQNSFIKKTKIKAIRKKPFFCASV